MGKREIALNEQFLLFPQCFQKTFTAYKKKAWLVWEKVNSSAHNILSNHWLLSNITTLKTTDSSERQMNLIVMTMISSQIVAELGIEPATSCSQVLNSPICYQPRYNGLVKELQENTFSVKTKILQVLQFQGHSGLKTWQEAKM